MPENLSQGTNSADNHEQRARITRRSFQSAYAGDDFGQWSFMEEVRHPQLAEEYAKLLLNTGLLPCPDKVNGFTFLSSSAHQGIYESFFARRVDESLTMVQTDSLPDSPLFIAADMFGERKNGYFVPGFTRQGIDGDGLQYTRFQKISAEAGNLPFPPESVTLIWDRLGALWHAQFEDKKRKEAKNGEVERVLKEYRRVLKKNGNVVIDASEIPTKGAGGMSTYDLLTGKVPDNTGLPARKVNFYRLGWTMHNIGSGESRLAILRSV